jgi:hypothetical protein
LLPVIGKIAAAVLLLIDGDDSSSPSTVVAAAVAFVVIVDRMRIWVLPKQEILEVWKGEENLKPKVETLASMFLDNSRRYEIVIEEWEVKE